LRSADAYCADAPHHKPNSELGGAVGGRLERLVGTFGRPRLATFLKFLPAPALPASAWLGPHRNPHSKLSAGTDFPRFSAARALPQLPSQASAATDLARFSVAGALPQLPFQAFSRYQLSPLQRGVTFASVPIPSLQPLLTFPASARQGLSRSFHSKLSVSTDVACFSTV
jgi:hypothetical protein